MGSETERAPGRAAAWIGLSAVALAVGSWISIPGIDADALAAAQGGFAGLFDVTAPAFPILGFNVGALVLVRLALALLGKTESGVGRALALAIYLVTTAVQTLSLALWAESAGYEMPVDLVVEPGWRFRLIAVLTTVAGGALLYWLADRVDATRAATGALALALLASLLALVTEAGAAATAFAIGESAPIATLLVLALPIAMLALGILLALRAPARWPVRVAGALELRSGLDVLAAPAAVAVMSGGLAGASTPGQLVRACLVIGAAVGVGVLLSARSPERAPRRLLWPLAVALASFPLALVPLASVLTSTGALSFAPGPLEGDARFRLTLAAVDRFRDGEADAMVRRLTLLGARASLVSADPQRITLDVERASDPQSVTDALRPHTLALHLVRELPGVPLPEGVRPPAHPLYAAEGPCEALRDFAPSLGCRAAFEPVREGGWGEAAPGECRLYCLEPTPVITGADVAEARASLDSYSNQPIVSASLTPDAAARFARFTGENVQRQLAIVLDGEVVSAPIIQSAIPGGQIQITLGGIGAYDDMMDEARLVAAALGAGDEITSEWSLEAVTTY